MGRSKHSLIAQVKEFCSRENVAAIDTLNERLFRYANLHLAAHTLNRPAIKALIKRRDLAVLALDDEGFSPSQRALEVDSRSPIGHLLLRKEIGRRGARH